MKDEKLIILPVEGSIVFVGDTHGDLDASQKVIEKYLREDNKIVFLGDYVDRGNNSKGNIDFLLKTRVEYPEQIYLLLGNHDAFGIVEGYPADFWESLNEEEKQKYFEVFEKFPLAVSVGNIMALHGALPDVGRLEDINSIKNGDENWMRIVWGDFFDMQGKVFGEDDKTGRPGFGRDYFNEIMERFDKKILIRSHQSRAPEVMYDERCLTIFTSSSYSRGRIVAIADFKGDIKSVDDLIIEEI